MRAIGSMSSRWKRAMAAIAMAAGVIATGAVVATPASAHDDWNRGRHHRHHHHHPRAYFSYGPPVYYAPPPRVYYAPPPVYYAPPPVYYAPPAFNLGVTFPLR